MLGGLYTLFKPRPKHAALRTIQLLDGSKVSYIWQSVQGDLDAWTLLHTVTHEMFVISYEKNVVATYSLLLKP